MTASYLALQASGERLLEQHSMAGSDKRGGVRSMTIGGRHHNRGLANLGLRQFFHRGKHRSLTPVLSGEALDPAQIAIHQRRHLAASGTL